MRIVTAIQPTGTGFPHLGNYLGVLKRLPGLADAGSQLFVADLHATTKSYRPDELRKASRITAACLLALDSEANVFVQSAVPEHLMLNAILGNLAHLGELQRMTQYSDRAEQDEAVSLGSLSYPALMASDILLYRPDGVPVGADQRQHMELVGVLAKRLARLTGIHIKPPAVLTDIDAPRVMSLADGRQKMSKSSSASSYISLGDSIDEVATKVRRAKTDAHPICGDLQARAKRPEMHNLVVILAAMTGRSTSACYAELEGKNFSTLKDAIVEAYRSHVMPYATRCLELLASSELDQSLAEGAVKAREVARPVVAELFRAAGLTQPQ